MDDLEAHRLTTKDQQMFDKIMSGLSMIALTQLYPDGMDQIKEKLRKSENNEKIRLLQDLIAVIDENLDKEFRTMDIWVDAGDCRRRIAINKEDVRNVIEDMKQKLASMAKILSFEDQLKRNHTAGKIFIALKARFPNVTENALKENACEISKSKADEDWKKIVRKINEENENKKPGAVYKRFRFFPSQQLEPEGEGAIHQYLAGLHFYRMLAKGAQPGAIIPVPLRKVANPQDAIFSIDYIKNPTLEEAFAKQKKIFEEEGKPATEMLLFHGTAVANVDSILRENFSLELSSDEQGKEKNRVFGEGVYFSEMPALSLMYGNGLILCKVLPGSCEIFNPKPELKQPEIPGVFDSREVKAPEGSSVIHVVRKPSQVLPYCVIQLKNGALSSEYYKPNHIQRDISADNKGKL